MNKRNERHASRLKADRQGRRERPAQPAEPVVRPAGTSPYNASVVRRARLFGDGQHLVVRDSRLRERRYPIGAGGIKRAVFSTPGDLWETVEKRPAERWGAVHFKGEDGRDILHVPLAAWLPEAGVVGALDLPPSSCLDRTGLSALVTKLGIPLEDSGESPGSVSRDSGQGRPDQAVHSDLPRWHSWVRGCGLLAWFIAIVTAFAADLVWAMPIAAGALFLVPASDAVLRVGAWWRNRQYDGFAEAVEIKPSPGPETGVTRRFLRTAAVRVLPRDVVLTDTVGEERWLGRAGEHGVARLVRLVAPETGEIFGVEFHDGGGEVRAILPWAHWFGGPQGGSRWTELVDVLNVPVSDVVHKPGRGATSWSQGLALAADVRKMSPLDAKEARKRTGWYRRGIGSNELLSLPLFSAVLLMGLFGDEIPTILAGWLSVLTIAMALLPAIVSTAVSRLSYDRMLTEAQGRKESMGREGL